MKEDKKKTVSFLFYVRLRVAASASYILLLLLSLLSTWRNNFHINLRKATNAHTHTHIHKLLIHHMDRASAPAHSSKLEQFSYADARRSYSTLGGAVLLDEGRSSPPMVCGSMCCSRSLVKSLEFIKYMRIFMQVFI